MMAKGKNVLTTGDVARICSVAPRTVSKWFDTGQLKGYRIPGSRDRRIPVDELVRFMKVHNMPLTRLGTGKTRILVVDSDREAAQTLAHRLMAKGEYDVQLACTNIETGWVAQRFSPHVAILNLLADGIDAIGICKAIRGDSELQTMKVFALTGRLGPSESQALLNKGFDDCIDDASDVAEVVRRLEQAVALVY